MYLKSLVLKGFKSFADRSVLSLEPGITAIVGPNGSGKSNISDAVLWVLGERNARNLRGQAMEDIIFSGSAARKAVSVAEVDLVLDNSDHTLPVEFDEVVITRRMFRSGESEYLVNGVVSRRLDVLDILHDTGLGTGTHSIISQGSLDSILQSKPEDRRALIEEAAGVLKHKQRKEKSARKLASMDNHLARVRDVAGEVARQLGPLERKAKRAAAYQEAHASLTELKLALAVDDLRRLQREWDAICSAEKQANAEIEARRASVTSAEQRVNDLQELIRRESEDAGELSRKHRRAENLAERLDSADMLVRERRRAAIGYEADMRTSLDGSETRRADALRELESAQAQLAEVSESCSLADKRVDELAGERAAIDEKRRAVEARLEELVVAVRACEQAADEAKRNKALLQESLSNGLAHVKLVEARNVELGADVERAREEYEKRSADTKAAKDALDDLEKREAVAQEAVVARFTDREQAREARERSEEAVRLIESEIRVLEQARRAASEDDPALVWLMDNAERFGGVPVAQTVKASAGIESLVERLLGDDVAALAVEDPQRAEEVASAIIDGALSGDVTMVARSDAGAKRAVAARASSVGHPLVDDLVYSEQAAPVIEALLGDVVVCKTREEAFAAHVNDKEGLRFVSPDGCAIWPNGKVRVYGAAASGDEGVLARERHLDELRERLEKAVEERGAATKASEAAEEAYREAQAAGLKLSQELANGKGVHAAAAAEEERAKVRMSAVANELEDLTYQLDTARKSVEDLRPDLEACTKQLEEHEAKHAELVKERDERTSEAEPLRGEAARIAEQLSEAKLSAATFAERRTYAERIVVARQRDIETIDSAAVEARKSLAVKAAAAKRGEELLEVFARLSAGMQRRVKVLDDAVSASESSSSTVHSDAAEARDAARKAHDDYDAASERATQVRVEKSRLEVQVEAAVNAVVVDLGTPLDRVEDLPPVEDRAAVEDEVFKLQRRIKSMGTINPDAAEEYAALKERYDFLAGQLADVEAARRSLARIVRVIDNRMKDDFARTFEEVNENFNEIFGVLFPGGSAYLSLVDPDDIDNSGVEVTAQPRGKRITKMMLMSGGEKSLTALALLFAVYKTRTTPFYILDEVEAALDDTNLRRLTSYIDTLRETTQLIMITHQRRTMEMADVLFGVSMQADGVTQVISQKLERALEHAE
ncbi:MAG: chromosome segregation protein SMC [Eggerthellaceae bacterium]|nr:chromosome segregation protein SMC [Eggerthellaceae bacterium]